MENDLWCVVIRHCRDYKSRGKIIHSNLSEEKAKRYAKNSKIDNWNSWAIRMGEY